MIPAVVLAAGLSSRMGRLKATLPLDRNDTFLTRIVRTLLAAGVEDVVVVAGYEAGAVRAVVEASGLPARFVVNERYREGQLSSLLAGLEAVHRPGVQAMLLTLVDVPLVSVETASAVLARYRATRAPIVRPVHGGLHGHPIVIDRSIFDLLRHADREQGAKPVVRAYATPAGDVEVQDEGAFLDIDTPADYQRITKGRTD
ncbi:MAG: NTP transferase domain-containing protein [Vicinamibacterales bacterium]